MLDWFARRMRLETYEARHALVLGLVLLTLTSSYTLVKTSRDALYLAELPAETLPWVYLGVGVVTFVAAGLFSFWTRRKSTFETLAGTALVSAISLAGFAWLFRLTAPWVPVVLYLWVNVYGLLLMTQFWLFANSVSDPREAKRIYGTVGVGGIVGGLIGGLLAPALAGRWGLASLMVVAAALLVFGVVVVASSVREAKLPPPLEVDAPDEKPEFPLKNRYIRWIAVAALCSVVVTGLLDYQFKVQIQQRYSEPGTLAMFLGFFYTILNLAALGMQLFVTRWALQRLGAGWASAVLPAGLAVGTALIMAVPGFFSVVVTRLWDQMLRQSVNRSAVEMFYFPIEPALRRRAKSFIDAGLERLGDAAAGGIILVLAAVMGANSLTLAALTGLLIVVWVAAWMRVRREYVSELGRNLRRMNLAHQSVSMSLKEASVLKEMERLLESPYERVVLHAMELMNDTAPEKLDEHLLRLTEHESATVRAEALRLALEREVEGTSERAKLLMDDDSAEVRVAALRAYAALDCDDPIGLIRDFLASKDRRLRVTALQCALEFAQSEQESELYDEVAAIVRDGSTAEKLAVAEALGRRSGPSQLHDLLRLLIADDDILIRRAALRSAGRAKLRRHIPTLIDALGERATRKAAREGLAAFGEGVVGTLGDWLIDSTLSAEVRREIPRVLGDIGTQEAVNALFRMRERADVRLGFRVLKAMNRMRRDLKTLRFNRGLVTEDLRHDVRSLLFALVHYRACPIGGNQTAERLLCIALNERMDQALDRMFRRLALIYPANDIYAAYKGIVSEDRRLRGNAVEYLENALMPEHRELVLPIVSDASDDDRLRIAESRHGLRFVGYNETLQEIIAGEDMWLRTCALFVVGSRREQSLKDGVQANVSARHPLVRETARWAREALSAGGA